MEEEHVDSKCSRGHPLTFVPGGYAYCSETDLSIWWAWRLTAPHPTQKAWWDENYIVDRDGERTAWYGIDHDHTSLEGVLEFIEEDADAHREVPFDEERDRLAFLMYSSNAGERERP